VPGLAGAACPRKLPTGGPTTLLLCVGGADPLQPGTRVSLRAWPPPGRSAP